MKKHWSIIVYGSLVSPISTNQISSLLLLTASSHLTLQEIRLRIVIGGLVASGTVTAIRIVLDPFESPPSPSSFAP